MRSKCFSAVTTAVILAAASLVGGGAAHAQSNALPGAGGAMEGAQVFTDISASTIATILQNEGITASVTTLDAGVFVRAEAGEGKRFWVFPRNCQVPAEGRGCGFFNVFAVMPGGLSLDAINAYHLNTSANSIVMVRNDGRVVVAQKSFVVGGVTRNNILVDVATFLGDADRVANLPRASQPIEVSFGIQNEQGAYSSMRSRTAFDDAIEALSATALPVDADLDSGGAFLDGPIARYITLETDAHTATRRP